MKDESISTCVDKFVKYGITIEEIKLVAPLVNDREFEDQYQLTVDIKELIIEEGIEQLRSDLKTIIQEESAREKKLNIIELRNYRLQIAAVLLVGVSVFGIIKATTGYNNESNYTKSYVEKR